MALKKIYNMNTWIPLISRRVSRLLGKESENLIQGISTNDMKLLDHRIGVFTAFLNRQGRFLADAFVFYHKGHLCLECDVVHYPVIKGLIDQYGPLHSVQIQDMPFAVISFSGPECHQLHHEVQMHIQERSGIIFQDPRHLNLGFRVILPYECWHEIPTPLCIPGTEKYYRVLCIQNGIPCGACDLVGGRSLILEYHYHLHQGISWKKGCYIGQEVIARSFYQNRFRRGLFRLTHVLAGSVLKAGEDLLDNKGNVQGIWGSFCSGQGLLCLDQAWALTCLDTGNFEGYKTDGTMVTGILTPNKESIEVCTQGV
ncbi:hypothetical protein HE1_00677 [Holospora elegans E1]|uniref:Transferase CAF17, mitochondrial n=2 Tax=Holospora TaxID=44747 RepID=A0A023DZ78_9PROT|nr:hypothetical protein HE1_00677 [Holospora elegans E1]